MRPNLGLIFERMIDDRRKRIKWLAYYYRVWHFNVSGLCVLYSMSREAFVKKLERTCSMKKALIQRIVDVATEEQLSRVLTPGLVLCCSDGGQYRYERGMMRGPNGLVDIVPERIIGIKIVYDMRIAELEEALEGANTRIEELEEALDARIEEPEADS